MSQSGWDYKLIIGLELSRKEMNAIHNEFGVEEDINYWMEQQDNGWAGYFCFRPTNDLNLYDDNWFLEL